MDKVLKVREPLVKKLAEEPDFMSKLQQEVIDLQQQIQAMALNEAADS